MQLQLCFREQREAARNFFIGALQQVWQCQLLPGEMRPNKHTCLVPPVEGADESLGSHLQQRDR